ncbi:MAG: hemolysin secretion protein D [Paracoccus denitrificans]|nr:MAG: hemolysin secretion protein D [Paracoccus denitrificans]PZO83051.1 MAG: hemolysin secretion protein D [Paracoccus denitrificans]
MNKEYTLPTLIALIIGLFGVGLVLYTWHLPPFSETEPSTENAYVRGRITTLAPQLSGYISKVAVQDFADVKKGDVIAEIDDRIYRQRLAQAKAGQEEADAALKIAQQSVKSAEAVARANEATLEAAKSALGTAQANRERNTALQTRGVSSQSSVDQTELAYQQADAAVTQAEAQVDVQREAISSARVQLSARDADIASAKAAVELAQIDLSNTIIRAPEDGRLGQVGVRVGQYVTAGSALVSHVGPDVWVIANFKETALRGMAPGQPVKFTVDALQGQAFTGRVQSFSPATASEFSLLSATNATGNFTKVAQRLPVRIAIDPGQDHAEYLAPGLSVIVHVDTAVN